MKFNHIAVILRGQVRHWHYLSPAVFKFYDDIATNVDYYFVTWNYGFETRVEESFLGRNLVKYLEVDITNNYGSSWTGSAWLNYNIVPYKRIREKTVKYDAVIDTRPDVIPYLHPDKTILPIDENMLYTNAFNYMITEPKEDTYNYLGMQDHFFVMSSKVFDVYSQRYIHPATSYGCHSDIVRFCNNENINVGLISWCDARISRPNAIDIIDSPFDHFKLTPEGGMYWSIIQQRWMAATSEEKLGYLTRQGIDQRNYETNSLCAKI
jgi:hypothetical protein